jgi:hypothetical protein
MAKVKSRAYRNGSSATYAHAKLDGHFTRVTKNHLGQVRVETSNPTDITEQMPSRLMINLHRQLPNGTTLLGELWVPGVPASSVKTHLIAKSEELRLTYFAIEKTPVRMLTCPIEEAPLTEVEDLLMWWGLPFADYTLLADGWSPEALMLGARDLGYEGWVLKDGNLLNWQKLKEVRTIDLVIEDFEDGEGKYLGLVGALVCRTTEGHVVANVSGMDDETRILISEDEEAFRGKVVEVRYQYAGSKGKLRHPAFVRFRDDKSPDECSLEQDEDLRKYYI